MSQIKLMAVECHREMRDSHLSIQHRIKAAVDRITHGNGQMRIPVEATDPDIVLTDCGVVIERLEKDRDELLKVVRGVGRDITSTMYRLGEGAESLVVSILQKYPDPEPTSPRFPYTECSQCGGRFGPGDHGYSHCENHRGKARP